MRHQAVVLTVIVAAAAVCLAAFRQTDKESLPAFKSEGYTLTCTQLESRSKIDLAEKGSGEHTLSIKATLTAPEREDVVAVTKALNAVEALDREQTDLIKRDQAKGKTSEKYQRGTFTFLRDGTADVEVKDLKLTGNPYRLRSMTVEAKVVVAGQRENKRLAAVVMGQEEELVAGLAVRIESIRVTAKREFTIVVYYKRNAAGPAAPFVEQLQVLDEDGTEIGASRWSEGDPFAETGSLTAKVKLRGQAPHKHVRLVAVTECEAKTLAFQMKNIFQN